MNALTHLITRNHSQTKEKASSLLRTKAETGTPSSEKFWCAFTFLLFLALGPFAAVPALFSILSLVPGCEEGSEPEMVGE